MQLKSRQSNYELLRIISMCGIIIIHYINGTIGGAIQNAVFPNFSWMYMHVISSICIPLVNCFVLISGYFMINNRYFSLRKTMDLLSITAFYGVVAYVISITIGGNAFEGKELIYAIIPFLKGKRWFVETYIILILLAPFLNKMLRFLNKNTFQLLLIIQLLIFSVWYSIGFSAPVLDDGYGIINFISLYMIGAYIRMFGKEMMLFQFKKRKLFAIFLGLSVFTFIASYFMNPYGYAFFTNILGAVIIFLLFSKWEIGENKRINKISKVAFDVYFVHSDENTSLLLIYELLGARYVADTPLLALHVILVIATVWLLGYCTYQIRKRIFAVTIDKWLNRVNVINRILEI